MEIKIPPQRLFNILIDNNIDRTEAKAIICDLVMEMSGCSLIAGADGEYTEDDVPDAASPDEETDAAEEAKPTNSRVKKPLNFRSFGGAAQPIT